MKISRLKKNFKSWFSIVISILIILVLVLIIVNPAHYMEISKNAITTWAKVLLPSLLPFFIFTKILTSLGMVLEISKVFKSFTKKMYNSPPISSYVFFISIISGYPVGSKIVADLYNNNQISKSEAKRIIPFTSNSGPMFILGSVAIGLFNNQKMGIILYLSHIIGAILNGLLYRNIKEDKNPQNNLQKGYEKQSLSSCVNSSISSILLIGGILVICFIIIDILTNFNVFLPISYMLEKFGVNPNITNALCGGILEITSGCINLAGLGLSYNLSTILCCFLISFGGFSTIFQAMAFLQDVVSYKYFILQKTTHCIISTLVCCLLVLI